MRMLSRFWGHDGCGALTVTTALVALGVLFVPGEALAQQPAPTSKPAAPAKPAAPKPPKPAQPAPAQPAPTPPPAAQPAPAQPAPAPPAPAQPAKPGEPAAPPPTGAAAPAPQGIEAQPAPSEPLMAPAQPAAPAPPSTQAAPAPPAVAAEPEKDQKRLVEQGAERPSGSAEIGARPSEVYAEDWWSHARPTFEFHGYFRVRSELFHNFALGRIDRPGDQLWPQPTDKDYNDLGGAHLVRLCGEDPTVKEPCDNNTQAGANMRFRLNPELHISDNLRVLSQIDLLDNLVMGSTPEGYSNIPSTGGYQVVGRGGYSPLSSFAATQWAPSAGQNSNNDSIAVKRVWGEYLTPVGLLRFGRMPSHWGLGMLANSGDGYDQDWASTADRIMLVTGIKKYDLYFAGAWDFANEGPTSISLNEKQGQPYDLGQLDDVSQYVLVVVRRRNPELQKLELARGDLVLNGGVYAVYRNQVLANDETTPASAASLGQTPANVTKGYVRRGAEAFIPDVWLQVLYEKFRFEAELAMIYGSIESTDRTAGSNNFANTANPDEPGWNIRQFGLATQTEYRAIEDRLKVQFGFGYASGDDDVDSLAPSPNGLDPQRTADRTFSTFRFHPAYNVDMILFRNILSRVEGAYYFRPSVDYDFTRDKNGQRLGGGAAVVWSRASEFVQAPGHARDLGIELDFQLYFQSKDGTLNDDPDKMGGFYTALQYGVMFPLAGLGYMPGQKEDIQNQKLGEGDTETAQILRWYLGVLF